jgi:SAM-dependent methyltransferase
MPAFLSSKNGGPASLTARLRRFLHWLRFTWMYFGKPPWDTDISPPELLAFIAQHPLGSALDLGCGTGTNLVALGKAGWQVTGVEFVPHAANIARRKLRRAGIAGEVRAGDAARYEVVQGAYDLALDIGCYHGLPESSRASYRQNLARILKPAGHFLIYAHWRPEGQEKKIGITLEDLSAFQEILQLEQRQDSQDTWGRLAVWMLFQKR